MDIKGFTKAENSILFNSKLTNNSKLIYLQIKYYSTIPNFKLSKVVILKDSGLSVNTFNKVIKELKEAGLVKQVTERNGKSNFYYYTLVNKTEETKVETKETKPKKKADKLLVDDNNKVLDGQIHIYELLEEEIEVKDESEKTEQKEWSDYRELKTEEVLIERTGEPIERVIHAMKYAFNRGAKELYSYALRTIQNDWDNYYTKQSVQKHYQIKKKVREANFTQRDYDFDSLESKLLGWDNKEINIPQLPSLVGCNIEKIEYVEDRKEIMTLDESFRFGA